ncbi:MAG: flagellar biosynthesis protein FlhA [Myxococcales bacterium]|nr:flagellar biosynthesis protein FlhA [Myxococcales bacterium]MDP3502970.1 flagellar biosynthesis protein FlhA [Myxococcales bacterium]
MSAVAAAPAPRIQPEGVLALAVLGVLGILVVPLPAPLLDALLALNVALSVMMLLVALGLTKAVEFSVFPSLLLITTLFRLSLNVATTRLILLEGGKGEGAAGHVIEAFGRFAVGGSLIVGAVIFLILLVVNFMVITKGSGRVSEVAARFTLDALPGKQMSIDADLAAGVIDEKQARDRRQALSRETEFFGAMDGASKFVRGDAIAGLIITVINIVGGLIAGLARDHFSFSQAVETYTVLTIGDGLITQLPALLVSTAAGVLVTRSEGADLGTQVGGQIFGSPRALKYTAMVLGLLALLPGLPTLAFGPLAIGAFVMSRRSEKSLALAKLSPRKQDEATKGGEQKVQDLLALDTLELEVGFTLLPLIDVEKGGELPGRVTSLRKQLATDMGLVLPSVHLKDNLRLDGTEYRVKLRGIEVGRGVVQAGRLMCLEPNGGTPTIEGIPGKDPAFGLPAVWVMPEQRAAAEARGYTLVDGPSVVTTHLSELIRKNAHELIGRQEVQELLGTCAKEAPKLVEDTVPGIVSLGELVRVLRGLLREGISVRDLRTILEAVADAAPRSKDAHFLVEQVRRRLARQITSRVSEKGIVYALTLERAAEEALRGALGQNDGEPTLAPDIDTARRLITSLETRASALVAAGKSPVVLAPTDLRKPLFDFASRFVPDLSVISARELVPGTTIEPAGTISLNT